MKSNINICYSCDGNYVQHMACSIASILCNSNPDDTYNFYVLDGGISEKDKIKIGKISEKTRLFNIKYVKIDKDDFKNCPITGYVNYITVATYYRFKIPSFFGYLDKILYLDCDTVANADVSELYNINIDDYYIAAVPEPYNHLHKERLEIQGEHYYCNAGVLLMNLKKIIADNIDKAFFKYIENPEHKIVYQDQDIINEVLKYKIKYINLQWNLQHDTVFSPVSYPFHEKERIHALEQPKLIHFTNKFKPWHAKCVNPYRKLYYKYLRFTPYRCGIKFLVEKLFFKSFSLTSTEKHKILKIFGISIKIKRSSFLMNVILSQLGQIKDVISSEKTQIEELKTSFEEFRTQAEQIKTILSFENNSISAKHFEVFDKYKNINKGKDVVLVATGPSVEKFKPIENAVYVGVNRAFELNKLNFDYIFLQDYSGSTKEYIDKFVDYSPKHAKKFIGYIVPYNITPKCVIPERYSYYPNIERYYVLHPSYKSNFTFDISRQAFGDSYSIVFPAMQFIFWTNPRRIFLVGCDCNTNGNLNRTGKNYLEVDAVLSGWKNIKDFATAFYPDTEIVSVNPVGLKGLFKDISQ